MSQDPYKSAQKEMDMLLKMEGGVNLSDRDKKQRISNKMVAGEEAGRLSNTAIPNYVPSTQDEDFELGTGEMPSVADFRKSMAERAGLDYIELSEFDLRNE
jgi:hypothetical protein